MSLSRSRWNQEGDQQNTQQAQPKNPNNALPAPPSKYIPPHSRSKPGTQANQKSRSAGSNIIIANGDRIASKKFSKPDPNFNHHHDPQLLGLVNSFNQSTLAPSHLDPMSLVPSPSRGIYSSPRQEVQTRNDNQTLMMKAIQDNQHHDQDLTNRDFQLKFFEWIFKKIKEYKQSYPNRMDLFLYLSSKDSQENGDFKLQIDRISSLVREIRKLREGIFASGRKDSFAIVARTHAGLLMSLESLDFAQLNTMLNHLIMELYRKVSVPEHSIHSESPPCMKNVPEKELESLINHQRRTREEVINRRIMFARVFLLLPIVTRLDLSQFIEHFIQIGDILSDESLDQALDPTSPPTQRDQGTFGISTSCQPKLLELGRFFKFILRKNYVQLNRKFIKPKLQKIGQAHARNDPIIQWDDLLFLVFLNLIRTHFIWKVVQKSYYHLSLEDDRFICNLLSLEFLNIHQFRRLSSDFSASHVNQLVNSWLISQNIKRNSKGIIQLK
ncbi:hypothetical protein VP01_4571g1 [Puccinia sorghi]|uniref:Uncharacterized protein n=1 Tax=Puccinia sorghi TaxID=27349 RepID=A0A0L6UPH8_9BASI|nr:hypothetical protein VP01_4571g1 [Puccinia sorghi]